MQYLLNMKRNLVRLIQQNRMLIKAQ